MYKITIVGAGRVGEATAQQLAQHGLCDELVLLDVDQGAAMGAALDIQESAQLFRFDARVRGGTDGALMAGSDLVIVTAGYPRRPGMSRSDVLEANLPIIDGIVDNVLAYAPDAVLMIISNPVDALTYRAWERTGWERHRVFGQAGVLDAARMASFVAMETGFSPQDITAMVLGGHGDAMVPLTRFTCVRGVPIEHFLDQDTIARIVQRTRQAGAEILSLRQSSSAFDTPAAAISTMVESIRRNCRRLLPAVCVLDGEYGQKGMALGVPVLLGAKGAERVVELALTVEEQALLAASAARVREDLLRLKPDTRVEMSESQIREARFETRTAKASEG